MSSRPLSRMRWVQWGLLTHSWTCSCKEVRQPIRLRSAHRQTAFLPQSKVEIGWARRVLPPLTFRSQTWRNLHWAKHLQGGTKHSYWIGPPRRMTAFLWGGRSLSESILLVSSMIRQSDKAEECFHRSSWSNAGPTLHCCQCLMSWDRNFQLCGNSIKWWALK